MVVNININFRPVTISFNNLNKSTNGSSVYSPNSASSLSAYSSLNSRSTIKNGKRSKRKQTTERGSDNNNDRDVMCSDIQEQSYTTYNSTQELTRNSFRKASQPINRSFSSLLLIFLIFILQSHLYHTQNSKQQYNTTHACEGKELEINCEPNYYIDVIRANFGRFSVEICNSEYIQQLPTKCMTKSAHRIINKRCQDQQNCKVLASESLFNNNTCPGVPKYLEVSYKCVNANSTRNASKRPYGNSQRLPANDTSLMSSKAGRFNPSIVNNDIRAAYDRIDSTINYDRTTYATDSTELNKRPIIPAIISPNPLDNNQNPFLNGKRVSPVENRPDDRSTFNPFGRIDQLNSLNSNKFEIKESPRPTLIDNRRLPTNLTNYCPAIKIKGASFELTQAGKLATVPCPAGSIHLVSWYCAPGNEEGQRAIWKDRPDFSKCSSLWLNSMDERLKEKYVTFSKLAQQLATVTNSYQDIDQNSMNQNSFLGIETPKQLNSISGSERSQQNLYARDLYRISEIVVILVNKLEHFIETSSDSLKLQQQFNQHHRKQQTDLIKEMLARVQDTISNLLEEQNRDSWLELQSSERTLAIASLMSSLKKNALLFASVRPMVSSNLDRFTRNLFVSVVVRQITGNQIQALQLPIKRSARSDVDLLTASETGEDESDEKQAKCSIVISSEKISQQSMQNLAKFIFIIYEQLGQLIPFEEMRPTLKRSVNTFDTNNHLTVTASDKTFVASVVASEIVSIFSHKESSVYSPPNRADNQLEPFIELTFVHNKFGQRENLTNFRCVQLQDSDTIPYSMTSNNRVLSVEQAAIAVANEQPNQAGSQVNSTEFRFLVQTTTCQLIFTNSSQSKCRCTGLGTFTVLADVGSSTDEMQSDTNNQTRLHLMLKLNRVCILSCAISSVFLIITIISFYFHKNNLSGTKTINHLLLLRTNQSQLPGHLTKAVNYQNILLSNQAKTNYLICLLFLECAMLTSLSLSESAQNNQVFCRLASLAIHYFVLTVFAWLLFDCFISSYLLVFTETRQHQHNQTNYMFNQSQPLVILNANGFPTTTTTTASNFDLHNSARQYTLRTCKLLTYLLPLFIVVMSSWIEPSTYCSKSWRSSVVRSSNELYAICWHAFDNFYIMFFIVPLIALLLASIVFVFVSIALRLRMKHLTDQQSNKQFTYLTNHSDVNQKLEAISSKSNLFASNTRINLYNVIITTCCWLSASLYLNNLLETFENFHFNGQQFEQSTFVEPVLVDSFARTFSKLPDSNLALFAFLFTLLNTLHSLVLLIKLGIREGLVSSLFSQFASICLFKSKQHSLNNLSQLYMPPNYCYNTDNQNNGANLNSLKYDQKQFNLGNKFEQNASLNSVSTSNHLQQQQPLIPPPQLITSKKYQLTQPQNYGQMSRDDAYENDDQQPFSEQQSSSETILASDQQISEQSDSEQFLVHNKNVPTFNDQYNNKEFVLKKNKVYGQKNMKLANAQMENFYECIEDNGQLYEPMVYSAAYGEHQSTDYSLQNRLLQSKYNRFINNPHNFSDVDSSEYENPNSIESFNRSRATNKLLRNYSSNDFLNERDNQSRVDQPLLPAIVRENTNYPQFSLSSTNHRNYSPLKSNRYNPTNASFSSTIGRNVLLSNTNGLRGSGNFRTASKPTKDMISEQEKSLKQIQQQLKNFQMQLGIRDSSSPSNNMINQENELKKFDAQSAQQANCLSSNSSVSDNVNSSV